MCFWIDTDTTGLSQFFEGLLPLTNLNCRGYALLVFSMLHLHLRFLVMPPVISDMYRCSPSLLLLLLLPLLPSRAQWSRGEDHRKQTVRGSSIFLVLRHRHRLLPAQKLPTIPKRNHVVSVGRRDNWSGATWRICFRRCPNARIGWNESSNN